MGETTSIQRNIVHEFYMQSQDHEQLWLLVSQLLIDLYDVHLIKCCHCGTIHDAKDKEYEIDTDECNYVEWDEYFVCSCWEKINPYDCCDLFY